MERYLITGAKGMIGSNMIPLLKNEGYQIELYDNSKLSSADVCLHLASKLEGTIEEYIDSNILYLQEIIEYCYQNKIKNFVFFSGARVYGEQNKLNMKETDCYYNPNTYALTKLLGENILEKSKLNVLILRLPGVVAHNSTTGVLSNIFTKLQENEELHLTNRNELFNNFISIKDIVRFINQYNFEKKFEIVNLAVEQEYTLGEIVELIKNKIGSTSIIIDKGRGRNFFNLSIEKIKNLYKFKTTSVKDTIYQWCESKNG